MKKFLSLVLIAFAFFFATSCKDDTKKTIDDATQFIGTQWKTRQPMSYDDIPEFDIIMIFDFLTADTFEARYDVDFGNQDEIPEIAQEFELEDLQGTWTYDSPNLYLTVEGETTAAVYDGTNITISGQGSEDIFQGDLVFKKL